MRRLLIPMAAAMSAMTAPTRRTPTPEEIRLRAELRDVRAQLAALEDVRLALQTANEGAYRAAYDQRGNTTTDGGTHA